MHIRGLITLLTASLLSYCNFSDGTHEVGEIYDAEYSYDYDTFGYKVTYEEKIDNRVELEIKKASFNGH